MTDYHSLSSVNDEAAGISHNREFPDVHILILDSVTGFIVKPDFYVKFRCEVCIFFSAFLQGMGWVVDVKFFVYEREFDIT